MRCNDRLRRRVAWLALCAVLFGAAAPSVSRWLAATRPGQTWVEVCSVGGTKRIALMLHRDCGAYGGSKSFVDTDAELNSQKDQLSAAKNFLSSEISDIPVDLYFADFDGLYAI